MILAKETNNFHIIESFLLMIVHLKAIKPFVYSY